MKKSRLYSIIALAISFTILCTSLVAPVIAKLVMGINMIFEDTDGTVHEDLDYTVNSVFEVRSQDEFFAAINQGYSYVQLSKDIENPLIITQNAENLERDLILDLNGIEIQRNGAEPILNVGPGVRLTVTDTSDEQTGGLYNPVGAVFNINGGNLTVITGAFECGPRYSEYYSYNHNVLANTNNTTKRTIVEEVKNVQFVDNTGSPVIKTAPIILSYPTRTGDIVYNHGNLYFDRPYNAADLKIKEDTYCYYRTSEDVADANTAVHATWYYTYYVDPDTYEYVGATVPEGTADQYVLITIYGYEDAIAHAAEKTNPREYYASIQMLAGELDVIKGSFFCYFGLENTACVNAYNGTLTIKNGTFSSRVPNATDPTSQNTVLEKEKDQDAFVIGNYFEKFQWSNITNTSGSQARAGKSYGILTSSAAAKVSVGTGKFYSSNNNVINMSGGGTLKVDSGTFTKQLTTSGDASFTQNNAIIHTELGELTVSGQFATYGSNTSAVFSEGGSLNVSGTFNVNGSGSRGVYSTGGSIDVGGEFTLTGNNSAGVYSEGGNVSVNGEFALTSDNSTGVYSKGGNVDVSGSFTLDGDNSAGVYSEGGTLGISGNFTLHGDYVYGVYSEGGTIDTHNTVIDLISSQGCYGVYVNTVTDATLTMNTTTINVGVDSAVKTSGTYLASAGIFLAAPVTTNDKGEIVTDATISIEGTTKINSHELGIAVRGGALNITGNGEITTQYASAIAVLNGAINFDKNSNYKITSKNTRTGNTTNSYDMYLYETGKTGIQPSENYPNTDGVYVSGGNFKANGTINITHTGLYNNVSTYTNYSNLTITSYALRVAGGSVELSPDSDNKHTVTITNSSGGGVYCSSGSLVLGNPDYETTGNINNIVKVQTTGTAWSGTIHGNGTSGGQGWNAPKIQSGGPAIELNGGNITVNNGTYTAALSDGVLAKIPYKSGMETPTATITINNGHFDGQMDNYTASFYSGPAGSYGLKVIGGANVKINGGTFLGKAGSASVTGVSKFTSANSYDGNWAQVYVKAGTFGDPNNVPNDGFMIFDKAKVVLGSAKEDEASLSRADAITIHSKLCPISVNKLSLNGSQTALASYVYIYYGTYYGGQSDVWNEGSFSYVKIYNVASSGTSTGNNVIRVNLSDNGKDGIAGFGYKGVNYGSNSASGHFCVYYPHTAARYFKDTDFSDPKDYNTP